MYFRKEEGNRKKERNAGVGENYHFQLTERADIIVSLIAG